GQSESVTNYIVTKTTTLLHNDDHENDDIEIKIPNLINK
ncbi:unnamed protein product, partial [Rotaria sp. Silwood1]